MGYVRKTLRKEHETPKRARFRCLVEQGMSRAAAARIVNVNRTTALKWLH
jgi:transposase-like protein